MDLDDLDAPSRAPSRVSKFAPKSSKLKPQPPKPKSEPQPLKPEPEPEPAPPSLSKSEPQELLDLAPPKKNEDDDAIAVTDAHLEPKPETEEDKSLQGNDPMDVDTLQEEEDTVVREIDVYFNPSIDPDTQLYVFQYPLRPSWRPYELDEQCDEVRLKPETSEVEVDLSIDMESSNIDKDFASKLNFKKQTLSTSWKPPRANGYAVGVLMGDKLHLHPVDAVVQLRPSLQHLNSGGSKKKNVVPSGANATVKIEGSIEENSAAKSKKQNTKAESSTEPKSDGDECWVPLKYHSCKSDISSRCLQQMVAQENSPINFTMSPYDYVSTLCPGVSDNSLPKGPSKRSLLLLPVEERLKKLLIEGRPLHRFNAIKHFAPEYSEEELLGFLQEHAILLQGLWTIKSPLLHLQGVEILARDHALILYSKKKTVYSSDVNVGGALGKYIKNYLKIFGSERSDPLKSGARPAIYWKFIEPPDNSFKKQYPYIAEKQEELLKVMEQRISDGNTAGKRKLGKNVAVDDSNKLVKSANSDQLATSVGGVPPGKMTMSNDTKHALPIALKKLFQNHKVCSFQMICQGLREMAVSKSTLSKTDSKIVVDAARSLDGPPEELKTVINEIAYHIHGSYVLKSSEDEPFRDVVINLFRGSGPNAKLKRAEIVEAARRKLSREVTNTEYHKVMSELCVSKGSFWVLRSSDGSTT
ncbi:hypothetical protein RIF29_41268 [Crotalaria pallida]|uniref:DNA-directed RNA polymerase III subunit RPC5 n=1 Tax=Crotalaria pallida TaxID=3830 RepID=A0AAN9EA81_CROPI